jgi:orotate phosphoribosyltransferase
MQNIIELATQCGVLVHPEVPVRGVAGQSLESYLDCRQLLQSYAARKAVTDLLFHEVRTVFSLPETGYDAVAGSVLGGLTHAVSLAQRLDVPVLALQGDRAYALRAGLHKPQVSFDRVASAVPGPLAAAIVLANRYETGFCYVRASPKQHGLGNIVEGHYTAGETVALVGEQLTLADAAFELRKVGLRVVDRLVSRDATPWPVRGKSIIFVEDVVNTGRSSLTEIEQYRALGATIDVCLSIFSYGTAEGDFARASVELRSLARKDNLLQESLR